MIVWGGDFLRRDIAGLMRCDIIGRYGSGKTALSLQIAHDVVVAGMASRVVSVIPAQIPGVEFHYLGDGKEDPLEDCAVVIDELGWVLESVQGVSQRRFLVAMSAALRKRNSYIINATVIPAGRVVPVLEVERTFNLFPLGLPFWVYTCVPGRRLKQKYKTVFDPRRVFSWYDTLGMPDDFAVENLTKCLSVAAGVRVAERRPQQRSAARGAGAVAHQPPLFK